MVDYKEPVKYVKGTQRSPKIILVIMDVNQVLFLTKVGVLFLALFDLLMQFWAKGQR